MQPDVSYGQVLRAHRRANRDTADRWTRYAEHRSRVTALAAQATANRLLVVGAGNCNDLDLPLLGERFSSLHLLDLDEGALAGARDRQPAATRDRIRLHAPVDASGGLKRVARWAQHPPSAEDLVNLPSAACQNILAALAGQTFDVTLSLCLLSQIVWACERLLGPRSPALTAVVHALVVAHLRALVRLTSPGGTLVLVTDTVGSDTYPIHELCQQGGTRSTLDEASATGVLFLGTSPRFLSAALRDDPALADLVATVRWPEPWIWQFSPQLSYLTYALVIERNAP